MRDQLACVRTGPVQLSTTPRGTRSLSCVSGVRSRFAYDPSRSRSAAAAARPTSSTSRSTSRAHGPPPNAPFQDARAYGHGAAESHEPLQGDDETYGAAFELGQGQGRFFPSAAGGSAEADDAALMPPPPVPHQHHQQQQQRAGFVAASTMLSQQQQQERAPPREHTGTPRPGFGGHMSARPSLHSLTVRGLSHPGLCSRTQRPPARTPPPLSASSTRTRTRPGNRRRARAPRAGRRTVSRSGLRRRLLLLLLAVGAAGGAEEAGSGGRARTRRARARRWGTACGWMDGWKRCNKGCCSVPRVARGQSSRVGAQPGRAVRACGARAALVLGRLQDW